MRRRAVFCEAYAKQSWGKAPDGRAFYSDSPEHLTVQLRALIGAFIRDHQIGVVVDLACGDFELASGIDMGAAHYIGADIAPALIEWDRLKHSDSGHEFHVVDMVEDDLPAGDLCMIHAVLYLLCERDVAKILAKLKQYRFVIITDGQPEMEPAFRKNFDKPTDRFTRQDYFGGGLWLELAPYNLDIEVLLENTLPSGEVMRTILLRHEAPAA